MPILSGKRSADMSADNTIPEGTYRIRVNKLDYREGKERPSGEKGDDYIQGDFVVIEDGPSFGRHIFQYMSLKPGDDWRLKQLADAIEYPADQDIDTDKFADGECYAVVSKTKGGKGKDGNYYPPQNQINRFMGLSAPAV